MILHISRMRRNVNRNVFNARKNVSATAHADAETTSPPTRAGYDRVCACVIACACIINVRDHICRARKPHAVRRAADVIIYVQKRSFTCTFTHLNYKGARSHDWVTVLCCAVLCCAVLCCAVLCCAVLCCAVLCCAVLCCAVLCCAVLCCAVCGGI